MLHDAADRLDAGRARELLDLGELVVGIGSLSQDREDEPALRLLGTWNHQRHYARRLRPTPPSPSARSRSSTSPRRRAQEARLYEYVKGDVGLPLVHDDGESLVYAAAQRQAARPARRPHRHRPGRGQPPRPDRGRRRPRPRRDRHEGRARRDDRARRLGGEAELAYDLGLLFFPREELGPDDEPAARRCSRRRRWSTRRRS